MIDSRRVKFSDENRQNSQPYVKSSLFGDDEVKQGTTTFSSNRTSSRLSFNSPIPVGRSSLVNTPNTNAYSPRPMSTNSTYQDSNTHSSDLYANNTPSVSRYSSSAGRTPHQAPVESSAAKERQEPQNARSPFAHFSGGLKSLGGINSSNSINNGGDVSFQQQGGSPMPERTDNSRGPSGPSGPPLRSLLNPGLLRPSTSYSSLQSSRIRGEDSVTDDAAASAASRAPRKEVAFEAESTSTSFLNSPAGWSRGASGTNSNNVSASGNISVSQDEEVWEGDIGSGDSIGRSSVAEGSESADVVTLRQRRHAASSFGGNYSNSYRDGDNNNMNADIDRVGIDGNGNNDNGSGLGSGDNTASVDQNRRKVLRFDDVDDILLSSSRQAGVGKNPRKKSICTQVMEYFFAF